MSAVARLSAGRRSRFGTGFVVCGHELAARLGGPAVITAAHPLDNLALQPQAVWLDFHGLAPTARGYPAARVAQGHLRDAELDVFVGALVGAPDGVSPAPLGPPGAAGDPLLVVGYPLGTARPVVTHGQIIAFEGPFLIHSAPTNAGSSGSPIINAAGQVIAVHGGRCAEGGRGTTLAAIRARLALDTGCQPV